MTHHRLSSLLVVLLSCVASWAAPRSWQDALAAARRQATLLGTTVVELSPGHAATAGKATDAALTKNVYLFTHAGGKGFTVVARDDRFPAIVAYAGKGTPGGAGLPDGFRFFMQAYNSFVEAVARGDAQAVRQLMELKAARQAAQATRLECSPLVHTAWGQGEPFNNLCPRVDGQSTATGCVATAMAQILACHRSATPLKAEIPGYTTATLKIDIPAVPAGTTYDWDSMLDTYEQGQYTDKQAEAVAKLMYHAGVSQKMNYNTSSSGASGEVLSFVNYFGFDADLARVESRAAYTLEQWYALLDGELRAGRPVMVSGFSSAGGHAFVCDGADGQGLYHINWGWNGYQDGYFDMGVLNPVKGGIGSGDASDGYVYGLSAYVGLMPDNGVADTPADTERSPISLMWDKTFSMDDGTVKRADASAKFEFNVTCSIVNPSYRDITFDWAIGIRGADGTYQPVSNVLKDMWLGTRASNGVMYVYNDYVLNCCYAFPEGRYALYAIVREKGSDKWKEVGNPYGVELPEIVVDSRTLTCVPHEESLTATLTPQGELVGGQEGTFVLTVTNQSPNQYLGPLAVSLSGNNDKSSASVAHERYLCLQGYESLSVPVTLRLGVSATSYAWVEAGDNVLVDGQAFSVTEARLPDLSLVGITSNATQLAGGLTFNGRGLAVPYADADKALLGYRIQNDGYAATVSVTIYAQDLASGMAWPVESLEKYVTGDGAVTSFDFAVPFSNTNSGWLLTFISLGDGQTFTCKYQQKVHFVDNMQDSDDVYMPGAGRYLICLSGNATGIDVPDAGSAAVAVGTQPGRLVITTSSTCRVDVCGADGRKVATVECRAGVPQAVDVSPGLYVVGGRKVAVGR